MSKDKKLLRKIAKSKMLSDEVKSIYQKTLENEIDERQLKREIERENTITGLLLEREILSIHLASLPLADGLDLSL